jgi:hypothetical protein
MIRNYDNPGLNQVGVAVASAFSGTALHNVKWTEFVRRSN